MASENFSVRQASPVDQQVLWEMLYYSLHVPKGGTPFPRAVVNHPEIAKYVKEWGRESDLGFIAVDSSSNEPIGAAWLRLLTGNEQGFGYVDEETPELGIAVLPEYRGRGVGTTLLVRLLEAASAEYKSVSLSVSVDNPALRLYERMGFKRVGISSTSITMLKSLRT